MNLGVVFVKECTQFSCSTKCEQVEFEFGSSRQSLNNNHSAVCVIHVLHFPSHFRICIKTSTASKLCSKRVAVILGIAPHDVNV